MAPSSADASVRPARAGDAARLGALQSQAWRASYAGLLPTEALDALEPAALTERWERAVSAPPDRRHHVLIATAGDRVVGFAAAGPTTDEDTDAARDAELHVLVVDPDVCGSGHGSRLLSATVEHLRADGFQRLHAWVLTGDDVLRAFLTAAGFAPDGRYRSLDLHGDGAAVVRQVRLHAAIGEPT